jgi:hypothetical protein
MRVGSRYQRDTTYFAGLADVAWIAQLAPACLPDCQRCFGALGDQASLLLGQGGVEVEHERIGVAAEFSHDEGDALGHQARDERHIARQPVQLGDQDATSRSLGRSKGSCELRAPVERISALAGFGFDVFGDDRDVFRFGEPGDRGALGLDAEAGPVLLPSRDTVIGNSAFRTKGIPPFALCMNPLSEQCHCCFRCCTATSNDSETLRTVAKNAHNRLSAGTGGFKTSSGIPAPGNHDGPLYVPVQRAVGQSATDGRHTFTPVATDP